MKHDTSNAFTHAKDHMLNKDGKVKPILLFAHDGGADVNPRFPGTLSAAVDRFKELDLDVHILYTNAPGYFAYNRVERRMAPLSKELSGLILPHDSVGSHLDDSGKTIAEDLEKQHFIKAGEILAEVWSNTVIDTHRVHA